ncbi:MAG TPA: hypothetical protein VGE34_01385 [Candidatus Saccharimonadales bacterium]
MSDANFISEIPGLALTAARYQLAENMADKIRNNEPIGLGMIGFIAADIADGAILRSFDRDTPVRRVADGVVDHMSVARVSYEIWKKNPESRSYIGVLATRAALVGVLNSAHLAIAGEVTKGRLNQKATNLATATFALAASSGNRKATHITGALASGIAIVTAASHLKDLGKKHVSGIREL